MAAAAFVRGFLLRSVPSFLGSEASVLIEAVELGQKTRVSPHGLTLRGTQVQGAVS